MNSPLQWFLSGDWSRCLSWLDALPPGDPHILQNQLLCRFVKSQSFEEYGTELGRLARDAIWKEEFSHLGIDLSLSCSLFEHSVLYYNRAVVLFHRREYEESKSILVFLFGHLSLVADSIVPAICFLLFEVSFILHDEGKMIESLNYLEKLQAFLESKKQSNFFLLYPPFKFTSHLYLNKARFLLFCKPQSNECLELLQFIRSREKKPDSFESLSSLFISAQVSYQEQNVEQTLSRLREFCSPKSSDLQNDFFPQSFITENPTYILMYNNAMGCTYFQAKKYHLASQYFYRAYAEIESNRISNSSHYSSSSHYDYRPSVLKNLGVSFLFSGSPEFAYRCLREVTNCLTCPLYWLRLGECCMAQYLNCQNKASTIQLKLQEYEPVNYLKLNTIEHNGHSSQWNFLQTKEEEIPFYFISVLKGFELQSSDGLELLQMSVDHFRICVSLKLKKEDKANTQHQSISSFDKAIIWSAYLKISFASLEMNNVSLAVWAVTEGLKMVPSKEDELMFRLYGGEAYLRLGRSKECEEILKPSVVESGTTLQSLGIYLQLALVQILNKNYVEAHHCLDLINSQAKNQSSALITAFRVYIYLISGERSKALDCFTTTRKPLFQFSKNEINFQTE
jgi:tetratricopeptide (TPR) repeat protein